MVCCVLFDIMRLRSSDILPCQSSQPGPTPHHTTLPELVSYSSPVPTQSEGKPLAELSGQSAVSLNRKIERD